MAARSDQEQLPNTTLLHAANIKFNHEASNAGHLRMNFARTLKVQDFLFDGQNVTKYVSVACVCVCVLIAHSTKVQCKKQAASLISTCVPCR
mgnify:CR=1 FL=1